MTKRFPEHQSLNLSEVNNERLQAWKAADLFGQVRKLREGAPSFVFYEGPPSANGMPGIHHVLARTIKDTFCRYKTMRGYRVDRKAGWDTHGLPVELGVEKALGITKEDIGKKISVDDYNSACRREVMKYTREWENLTDRMGYWVDMENPYITYDNRYIESVWWLLSQLHGKGYLYKGYTIQPYSPAAGTGLSSHELNQPGCYRDVKDTTITAQFELTDAPAWMQGWGKPVALAWTTTPWTLPSNTALAVGPEIEYSAVRTFNPYSGEKITALIATDLLGSYFKAEGRDADPETWHPGDKTPMPWSVVHTAKGSELTGLHYRQLLPWVNPGDGAFRVIPADYVTTADGTGIVHIAGTFGADDLRVSRLNNIPPLHLIDREGALRPMVDLKGRFFAVDDLDPAFVASMVNLDEYSRWAGKPVKNAYDDTLPADAETLDVELCMDLKAAGKAFKIEKHTHNYPHCWRTDKPVLYYPLDSWFIRTTAAKDTLTELNGQIKWKPASTGSGRFGKWLENLQDWNLSRSRYWGTPLPIWRTDDGREEICIGSAEQLYNELDKAVAAGLMPSNPLADKGFKPGDYSAENYEKIDLHRPYVDAYVLVSPSGKPMHRELDLIDVWFDSGAMPFAQAHYPFENKEAVDNGSAFPADFIAEGVDQTRGWFFTLHAIAGMARGSVAYKAVVSNGLVLDKDGNKMSKRLGNAVDPFGAIDDNGSDPLRWYMLSNNSPWENLKYDDKGVKETARKMFATLFNTYSFFAQYANIDGFDPATAPAVPVAERPEIDRWIVSRLNSLVADVTRELDDYEPTTAARAISDFVVLDLSNWYVRLNRRRFWDSDPAAYHTLYECLLTVSRLMAPMAPFYADRLYSDLTGGESVHLASWPVSDPALINADLERRMSLAQTLTSMVLALRRKVGIKVRQPLSEIIVPVDSETRRNDIESVRELVLGEVNVKKMRFVGDDGDGLLTKRVKPDFKKLGPKHGKAMKAVAARLQALGQKEISTLSRQGWIDLDIDGETRRVDLADVEVFSEDIPGWLVANEGALTVALDVTLTPELEAEGMAREIVNRIQNLRKERDYNVTDRITLAVDPAGDALVEAALASFGDFIARQTLATAIAARPVAADAAGRAVLDIDGRNVAVEVEKAG